MILACPQCGRQIERALVNGIASCGNCNTIFNSSLHNRLLSASWLIKNNFCHGIDQLISDTKLPEEQAILVYSFVADNLYSPQEFGKVLKKLIKDDIDSAA